MVLIPLKESPTSQQTDDLLGASSLWRDVVTTRPRRADGRLFNILRNFFLLVRLFWLMPGGVSHGCGV